MREMSDAMKDALQARLLRLAYLVDLEFDTVALTLWTGHGDIEWSGQTWLGNGWLKPFSGITESNEIRATGCDINLSGVPDSLLSLVLSELTHQHEGRIYLAAQGDVGEILLDPILIFAGHFDTAEIRDSARESNLVLKYESAFIDFARSPEFRYTPQTQKALFPETTDKGFDYISGIEDWSGFWGRASSKKVRKKRDAPRSNRR